MVIGVNLTLFFKELTKFSGLYLFEIGQTLRLPLDDGGHSAERSLLELLAPVQRVAILEQPDVILGHVLHEMPRRIQLKTLDCE